MYYKYIIYKHDIHIKYIYGEQRKIVIAIQKIEHPKVCDMCLIMNTSECPYALAELTHYINIVHYTASKNCL